MMISHYVIRDSVHGDIRIKENIVIEIINTFEFQRLRRIKQFGGCVYPFPSGNHTRFSHSIGVYYVISNILQQDGFDKISKEDQLLVKLAGLLHDIGHGPFSHSFEAISPILHEEYGSKILLNSSTSVNKILQKYKINIKTLTDLIEGKSKNTVLSHLVSSQLDADRLDYLLRDSQSAGVSYSAIDTQWIIRHMVNKNGKIYFHEKARYAIENYLVSRYHMYKQIYTHEKSVAFDAMLTVIIKRIRFLYYNDYRFNVENLFIIKHIKNIIENKIMNIIEYCKLDDYVFHTYLTLLIKEKDEILSDLCKRFVEGNFFKRIKTHKLLKIQSELKKMNYNPKFYFLKKDLKKISYYDFEKIKEKKDHEILWLISDLGGISKFINSSDLIGISKIKKPQEETYYFTLREVMLNLDKK